MTSLATRTRRFSLPQTSQERMTIKEEDETNKKVPFTLQPLEEEQEEEDQEGMDVYWDDPYIPPPPDGGWGWVIVFASFMCNMIVDGIAYTFGVFLLEFDRHFQEGLGKTSWVGSLLSGCYMSVGPIVSALTNRFGCRPVTIAGSILSCAAFILCTFSPNIDFLMLTYGVMGGIGFGLIYLPAIVSVGYYFERKRALATGIAVCGSGVGTFLFAPLSHKLLENYDWKGAMLIIAGLVLNCTVFGALMRPLELKPKKEDPKQKPLLQRIAEEKKWQMERGSICGSAYFMVQLPDGTMERRPKYNLNMEPGVHSSFNLDQFGKMPETPVSAMPLPTIAENGKPCETDGSGSGSGSASNSGSVVKMMIGSGSVTDCARPPPTPRSSLVPVVRMTPSRMPNGIPKNYSVPILEGMSRRNGILRQDSFVKFSHSNIAVNGDMRKQSLRLKVSSGSLTGQSGGRNNNYSVEEVWVRVGDGGLGSAVTITEKQQRNDRKEYARPMYRKDIFYSGSIRNLPEYNNSQRDINIYRSSVTSIPRTSVVVLTTEADGVTPAQVVVARVEEPSACTCLPHSMRHTLSAMLDVSLIKNPIFMTIAISNVFGMLGFYVPFFYITDLAIKKGISKDEASYLISVIGITNTFGRIFAGWLSDQPFINSLLLNNICILFSSLAVFIIPLCPSYATLILISLCFGLFVSAYISLTSIILVELLGLDKLTNAFGLLILFRGFASILGTPLAGQMFDATGSYDISFYIAGTLILIAGLISFLVPCVARFENRRQLRLQGDYDAQDTNSCNQRPVSMDASSTGTGLGQIETTL